MKIPTFNEFVSESLNPGQRNKFEDFKRIEPIIKKKSAKVLNFILDFFEGNDSLLYFDGKYSYAFEENLVSKSSYRKDLDIYGDFSLSTGIKFEAWGYRSPDKKKLPAYLMISLEGERGIVVAKEFVRIGPNMDE